MRLIRVLPKGTIVKLGNSDEFRDTAKDLVIQFTEDAPCHEYTKADIIENPNGWKLSYIRHKFKSGRDTIIRLGYKGTANNAKTAQMILDQVGE